MHLKRFRRPTVREALQAAREALGPDALVLATDMVAASGWRGWMGGREVQITAAVDREVSERRPAAVDRRPADTSRLRDGLVARLVASGLDRPVAEGVAAGIPDHELRGASMLRLRRALATELEALTTGDAPFVRAEVFVGPPGVGKTTTIAKIAARERAGRGRTLGMIAADGFRAGAIEQLRVYADIIGAPFRVARTAEELDKALSVARQPLLVDTAGRSPRDAEVRDVFHVIGRRRHIRTHLVLAADTSAASARRLFDAYAEANPERVVITKIDETESLSPLLTVVRERQLPISYLAAGQRVPEDLEPATPSLLAAALLRDGGAYFQRFA